MVNHKEGEGGFFFLGGGCILVGSWSALLKESWLLVLEEGGDSEFPWSGIR